MEEIEEDDFIRRENEVEEFEEEDFNRKDKHTSNNLFKKKQLNIQPRLNLTFDL